MLRYALIGAGHRAQMYADAIGGDHADVAALVAILDTNPGRAGHYQDRMTSTWGYESGSVPTHHPDQLEQVLADTRADRAIICSPDYTHADLICRCLHAEVDVIVEKPLTIAADMAARITQAVQETGHQVIVTFNYRYSPRNSALRELIASGAIGAVTSMTFEWVLDTAHGADYFRRWHRDKQFSGGLLIHKASHHFDLVNWWLADVPERVFASGGVRFYGAENAEARGLPPRPARGTHDGPKGPFELDLREDPRLEALYLQHEHHDGYHRDQDVFGPGVTTEDNLAVIVNYRGGPTLSYSLNAHSPWEGYRVGVNGTAGRAELEVVERSAVVTGTGGRRIVDPSAQRDDSAVDSTSRVDGERLLVQRHFDAAREVEIPQGSGAHGGGDELMLADLFRGRSTPDPLGRPSDWIDGMRAIAVGICGNESIKRGSAVRPDELGLHLDR